MAFQTGYNKSGEGISSHELLLIDLPSKRLLGEGPAGIGYETEWEGKRCVRKDFVGVASSIFLKEAANLVGLEDHKNIVKTYGWTIDKRSCSLVLEYMDDDLLGLLQKRKEWKRNLAGVGSSIDDGPSHPKPFGLLEALNVIKEIADGVKQLHDKKIAHGDLKTRNILVNYANDLGDANSWSVKVADFGLAQTKRKSISFVSRQARKLDMVQWKSPEYLSKLISLGKLEDNDETSSESGSNSDESASTRAGASTDPFKSHDAFAADVYSFAVTCSQILTGEDPYPNLNWKALVDKILNLGLRPKLLDACPPSLNELLQCCWDEEPSGRPPFSEIQRRLQVILGDVITREEMDAGPHEAVVHLEVADEIQTALKPLSVSQIIKGELNFGKKSKPSDVKADNKLQTALKPLSVSQIIKGELNFGKKSKPSDAKADNKLKVIELRANLCCDVCARKMREALEDLEGVEEGVITDLDKNKVTVMATTKPETVLKRARKLKKDAEILLEPIEDKKHSSTYYNPHSPASTYQDQEPIEDKKPSSTYYNIPSWPDLNPWSSMLPHLDLMHRPAWNQDRYPHRPAWNQDRYPHRPASSQDHNPHGPILYQDHRYGSVSNQDYNGPLYGASLFQQGPNPDMLRLQSIQRRHRPQDHKP